MKSISKIIYESIFDNSPDVNKPFTDYQFKCYCKDGLDLADELYGYYIDGLVCQAYQNIISDPFIQKLNNEDLSSIDYRNSSTKALLTLVNNLKNGIDMDYNHTQKCLDNLILKYNLIIDIDSLINDSNVIIYITKRRAVIAALLDAKNVDIESIYNMLGSKLKHNKLIKKIVFNQEDDDIYVTWDPTKISPNL